MEESYLLVDISEPQHQMYLRSFLLLDFRFIGSQIPFVVWVSLRGLLLKAKFNNISSPRPESIPLHGLAALCTQSLSPLSDHIRLTFLPSSSYFNARCLQISTTSQHLAHLLHSSFSFVLLPCISHSLLLFSYSNTQWGQPLERGRGSSIKAVILSFRVAAVHLEVKLAELTIQLFCFSSFVLF